MKEMLNNKQMKKLQDELDKHTYTCKCGHRVVITPKKEKILCNWCNEYVFKNKKDEFKYRIQEQIRRKK